MITCQRCGVEAPTRYVEFHQNIGLLVVRFHKTAKGYFCKDCINKTFWPATGITLIGGWWGIISAVLTPFILVNNIWRYIGALNLPAPAPNAVAPILTDETINKIKPYNVDIFTRLSTQDPADEIASAIAQKAGVTQGQVMLYIMNVMKSLQTQR
jgi:hypothetical protein